MRQTAAKRIVLLGLVLSGVMGCDLSSGMPGLIHDAREAKLITDKIVENFDIPRSAENTNLHQIYCNAFSDRLAVSIHGVDDELTRSKISDYLLEYRKKNPGKKITISFE